MKRMKAFMGLAALAVGLGIAFSLVRNGERLTAAAPETPAEKPIASVSPELAAAVVPAASTNQTATVRGTLPFVLTSKTPIQKSLRLEIEAMGAKVLGSRARNAVLIEATPAVCKRLAGDARFEKVVEVEPSSKIQPALAKLVNDGAKEVEVSIIAINAVDREAVIAALQRNGGEMLTGCINEGGTIRAKLPSDCVATLAKQGEVCWLEHFVRPQFLNDLAVNVPLMNVRPVWNMHGLTGYGQHISTSDTGIDTGDRETLHEDLRNQVKDIRVVSGCNKTDSNGHGTHTAGSIVGNGAKSGGQIKGTAFEANLYAWFCAGTDGYVYTPTTMRELYRNNGSWPTFIHSASWGSAYLGAYTSDCVDHDAYVWSHPEFLPVFSAGNEGWDGYGICTQSICSPASAKNVLAVGATQSTRTNHDGGWGNGDPTETAKFSSRGPCKDGRTKPDIAAPGVGILSTRSHGVGYDYGIYDDYYAYDSGTSMSCPLTAGAVALVRQWLVERHHFDGETEVAPGVTNRLPTSALMKAVIMGGAKDRAIPDNNQGWGRVDLEETLFPTNGRAVKLIDRIPFAENFTTNIVITTTNAAPLDVQLVWVDYPGSSHGDQTESRLVNDLDLTVECETVEGITKLYGNGGASEDRLNNAESVHVAAAPVAAYRIKVSCSHIFADHKDGGAAALYIRGAFASETEPETVKVHLAKLNQDFYTLDTALAAVKDDDETVTILDDVVFTSAVTLTNKCTITSIGSAVVRCSGGSLLTAAGANAAVTISGVAFTNAFAGLVADAGAKVNASSCVFGELSALTAKTNSQVSLDGGRIVGDAPTITAVDNGVVVMAGLSVSGDACSMEVEGEVTLSSVDIYGNCTADWGVSGRLVLQGVTLATNQTVTVATNGNLMLIAKIANLSAITLEAAEKKSLTLGDNVSISERIEVTTPGKSANGDIFGEYVCDYDPAKDAGSYLVNALDPEGDFGGLPNSADGTLRWGVVEAPEGAAGAIVKNDAGTKFYYTLKGALRAAKESATDATITMSTGSTLTNVTTLTYNLALKAKNDAKLTLSGNGQFEVPAGKSLTLTNLVVQGDAEKPIKDCAFKVTGGALVLERGATLSGLCDKHANNKAYGGTITVTAGSVTMNSGATIKDCVGMSNGGAIWVGGTTSVANLFGGTITGCSAPHGGAVYVWGISTTGSTVRVKGDFTAVDNHYSSSVSKTNNLFIARKAVFELADELTGEVGVSFGMVDGQSDLNALGAEFVGISGVSTAAATASAPRFFNDIDDNLIGSYTDGKIVWAERPVDNDGQCTESVAGVRVTVEGENGYRYYVCIDDAFDYVKTNATFEVKGSVYGYYLDGIKKDVTIDHDVRITSWGDDIMILWRTRHAMYKVVAGGSLTLANVKLVGACSYKSGDPWDDNAWNPFTPLFYDLDVYGNEIAVENPSAGYGLISVNGGSLTLADGARVGYVHGNMSRASNAIAVFNGGTVTMESGSRVMEVNNEYIDDYETSCGGGILLDRATGYFNGGLIYNCKAYRAGGLYVANVSTAYLSGDIYIGCNYAYKDDNDDNVVVSENSKLVLAGLLECKDPDGDDGYIGVNEGISCDSNCFATVEWEWTDLEELEASAAYFCHDRRGEGYVCGVPVTNGLGQAVLVWSDSVSSAGAYVDPTGAVYRTVSVAPGLTALLPQVLSLSSTTVANGNVSLTVAANEGVDCWYTIYETKSLAEPFNPMRTVFVKAGEAFTFEIDPSKKSQFYKIEAR